MTVANILFIQPTSIFSVTYSALMIFMVLVGGLGTFEGPILGAIILYFIQQQFGNNGTWYLIGLGVTAVVFALLFPRGLWGLLQERTGFRLMPVGYRVTGQRSGRRGNSTNAGESSHAEPQQTLG